MAFCKFCQGGMNADSTVCPNCGRDNAVETDETAVTEAAQSEEETSAAPAPEEAAAEQTCQTEAEAAPVEQSDSVQEPTDQAAVEPAAPAPAKKKMSSLAIAAIVVGVLAVLAVLAVVAYSGVFTDLFAGNKIDSRDSYSIDVEKLTPDSRKMDQVVARIGDNELTNGEFQIYYWMQFYNLANTYGEYLSYMGLETSQPFDGQDSGIPVAEDTQSEETADGGEEAAADGDAAAEDGAEVATLTWEQYFIREAIACYEEYVALADAAEAAGLTLPEEYQASLDALPDDLQASAEEAGLASADELVQRNFGTGATVEDYASYMRNYLMAATYVQDIQNNAEYTEADVEAYYDENAAYYESNGVSKIDQNVVNVRHILIQPELDVDADDDGEMDDSSDEAWATAKTQAYELYTQWQEDPTEDHFSTLATEHTADTGSAESGGLYEDVYPGQMVEAFNDWCFDSARKAGDTAIVKTSFGYHIMYFVGEGDHVYWYTTAESDYLNQIYMDRYYAVTDQVKADVKYKNIYVNSVVDMAAE